ncbi:MAG: hypothetical protein R2708_22480 [Vicinamibacterales bacterium]
MTGVARSQAALLQTFVNGRRGLRFGSLFGAPAVFAGRRAAIRLDRDSVALRLGPAGCDLARTLCRGRVLGRQGGWLRLASPGATAPPAHLTLFERAVHDVATT